MLTIKPPNLTETTNCGSAWSSVEEGHCKTSTMVMCSKAYKCIADIYRYISDAFKITKYSFDREEFARWEVPLH